MTCNKSCECCKVLAAKRAKDTARAKRYLDKLRAGARAQGMSPSPSPTPK
jgi:hypothetical protein